MSSPLTCAMPGDHRAASTFLETLLKLGYGTLCLAQFEVRWQYFVKSLAKSRASRAVPDHHAQYCRAEIDLPLI